jgi:hypothetical protein
MHAIDGGRRFNEPGAGFARLYADVFTRPLLTVARPPLRLVSSDGTRRAPRTRRGCGNARRHLQVVVGGPR